MESNNKYITELKQLESEWNRANAFGLEDVHRYIESNREQQRRLKSLIAQVKDKIANHNYFTLYVACDNALLSTFTDKDIQVIQYGLQSSMERSEDLDRLLRKIRDIQSLHPSWELVGVQKLPRNTSNIECNYSFTFCSPEDMTITCSFEKK